MNITTNPAIFVHILIILICNITGILGLGLLNILGGGLTNLAGLIGDTIGDTIGDLGQSINEIGLSEDGKLNFTQLSAKYGFPKAEVKEVVTQDGYILTLHHIPGDQRRPVLLAHGNTADSACFIIRGNGSLAITLARKGYDVWAINFRGTTLSRRHQTLNADTQAKQFFNYTFYEQAVYDLPPTIDLILNETKQTQLLAIGHSIGTTNFYILGSEKPEYNAKIKAFISLAPISYMQDIRGITVSSIKFGDILVKLADVSGVNEVYGYNQPNTRVTDQICLGPGGYEICVLGQVFPTFGYDPEGFEREFVSTFYGHYPSGSSAKLFNHTLQIANNNRFAKFDYGPEGNLLEYGSETPSEFNLSKVSMKVALFVGLEDYLSGVKDADRLNSTLPNVVHYEILPYEKFNHIDFVWGRFMPSNLYPYIFPIIDQYIN